MFFISLLIWDKNLTWIQHVWTIWQNRTNNYRTIKYRYDLSGARFSNSKYSPHYSALIIIIIRILRLHMRHSIRSHTIRPHNDFHFITTNFFIQICAFFRNNSVITFQNKPLLPCTIISSSPGFSFELYYWFVSCTSFVSNPFISPIKIRVVSFTFNHIWTLGIVFEVCVINTIIPKVLA